MIQADRVYITPPTNTPVDTTRRRFLAVAAVGSLVGAGSLAAAAMAPDVPKAITSPPASPALRDAIRALDHAHTSLKIAQAANEEAEAIWTDWERQHPQPASKRGRRRWTRRADIERIALTSKPWQALMRAELVFARAQCVVALVPITGPADLHGMAVASAKFDRVELDRGNRSPIGLMVATEIALGSAVQS
jgi:hypothetical protein